MFGAKVHPPDVSQFEVESQEYANDSSKNKVKKSDDDDAKSMPKSLQLMLCIGAMISVGVVSIIVVFSLNSSEGGSSDAVYDGFVPTARISTCYTDCSVEDIDIDPIDWTSTEYCAYSSSVNCAEDDIASYTCVPMCLKDCPDVFCKTMATLFTQCENNYDEERQLQLTSSCVASYAAQAPTKTAVIFSAVAQFSGISAADFIQDIDAQYAARTALSLAMDGVSADQINVTAITENVVAGSRRRLDVYGAIDVNFAIVILLEEMGYSNTDAKLVYESVTEDIEDSFGSGDFQELLMSTAESLGIATLADVGVESTIAVSEFEVDYIETSAPTALPTYDPSGEPQSSSETTGVPSTPSVPSSAEPASEPSKEPSGQPTASPSAEPSAVPSAIPTESPSAVPSAIPTASPSGEPSGQPTESPSAAPLSFLWVNCSVGSGGYLSITENYPVKGFPYSLPPSNYTDLAVLPLSSKNVLLTLVWIASSGCSMTAVARSYGGYEWEGTALLGY